MKKHLLAVSAILIFVFTFRFNPSAKENIEDLSRYGIPSICSVKIKESPVIDGAVSFEEYGYPDNKSAEFVFGKGIALTDRSFQKYYGFDSAPQSIKESGIKMKILSAYDDESVYFALIAENADVIKGSTDFYIHFGLDGAKGAYLSGSGCKIYSKLSFSAGKIINTSGVYVSKTADSGEKAKGAAYPENGSFCASYQNGKCILELKLSIDKIASVSNEENAAERLKNGDFSVFGTLFAGFSVGNYYITAGYPSGYPVSENETWKERVDSEENASLKSPYEVMKIPVIFAESYTEYNSDSEPYDAPKGENTPKEIEEKTKTEEKGEAITENPGYVPETEGFLQENELETLDDLYIENGEKLDENDITSQKIGTYLSIFMAIMTVVVAVLVSKIIKNSDEAEEKERKKAEKSKKKKS